MQKFVNDYKARYNGVPDALAATAYDAAHIMFDAIKRAKSLDGTAIRDALAATKDFPGVTGNVTFNENRDAVKPIVMIEIKDGGTMPCANASRSKVRPRRRRRQRFTGYWRITGHGCIAGCATCDQIAGNPGVSCETGSQRHAVSCRFAFSILTNLHDSDSHV